MPVTKKLVENDKVKKFVENVYKLRDTMRDLPGADLQSEESVPPELLSGEYEDIYNEIKNHFKESLVDAKGSKLTESQTTADLNELWTVVKLLDGVQLGISSRLELLGIESE